MRKGCLTVRQPSIYYRFHSLASITADSSSSFIIDT